MNTSILRRFDFCLGSAVCDILDGNYGTAMQWIKEHISGKSLPRPVPIRVKESEDIVHRYPFNVGASLKHIFAYTRNRNKKELRVAIKYLLKEKELYEMSTLSERECLKPVGNTAQ